MSQKHYDAFVADIRTINTGFRAAASSLQGLLTFLNRTKDNPQPMTASQAIGRCTNSRDTRLAKYFPAIERLISVWGRGVHRHYPPRSSSPEFTRRVTAANNFRALKQNILPLLDFDDLLKYEDYPFSFNTSLGGAQARVRGFDITARSLLLKAGLTVPVTTGHDKGYAGALKLSNSELEAMRGKSILEVACGGSLFLSEMATLYNARTLGVDLNPVNINAGIEAAKTRYVKSMLYLKMLKDLEELGTTRELEIREPAISLIDPIVQSMQQILAHYLTWPPQRGDVFRLLYSLQVVTGELAPQFDFTVSMNMLGYFTTQIQQTDAVRNILSVTKHTAYLFSGLGGLVELRYDKDAIAREFRCIITEKDNRTHKIMRVL